MSQEPLYLIDGSGFIFRAYHALPPMSRPDGTPVNALFGFCKMLTQLYAERHARRTLMVFDAGRETFRNKIYPAYKAHRPPPPEDLVPQFALIREAAAAFGLPQIELPGFEADDIIATYTKMARTAGWPVVIVSADKDLMQLVGDGVNLYDTLKDRLMGVEAVIEKFGVPPEKVVDVQALAGDAVDNVPGVPGIGVKTAAQLINDYGDLEGLLARTAEIKQPKRRESLENFSEQARISKQLVRLADDAPVTIPLDQIDWLGPDAAILAPFLQQQNFRSMMAKFAAPAMITEKPAETIVTQNIEKIASSYHTITDLAVLKQWLAAAQEGGVLAIDTETDSLQPSTARLVGISIASTPGKAAYIPLGHRRGDQFDFGEQQTDDFCQLPIADVVAALKPILDDPSVLKIGHNIKFDFQVLAQHGLSPIAPYDDTMLMSYVLDGSQNGHGMDELAEKYFSYSTIKYDDVTGTGRQRVTFDLVPIERATPYAAEDADITLRLYHVLQARLVAERRQTLYQTIDRPLPDIVARMESAGIAVDAGLLRRLGDDFARRLVILEQQIHALAGQSFNIASPKQMGDVLFGSMGLPSGKKSKTGQWSTSQDVLEPLAEQHDIVRAIMDWRQLAKLRNTYTEALLSQLVKSRVHTSFSLAATNTGRFSSSDPNLQNIPIRTEEGRQLREAFVAPPGHVLISADYSQIELRLIAAMANIPSLKQAFRDGIDIHIATASKVFGIPLDQMTNDARRQAKAVNFGIIYGISAFGLSKQLGSDPGHAKQIIDQYFRQFPELRDYMEQTKDLCRAQGFVETLFGRRVHIAGIKDRNAGLRQFAERQAINAPIQGTAADIIRRAMIRVDRLLRDEFPDVRLLLQVHDELVFEAPENIADKVMPALKNAMQQAATLEVPLLVEIGKGLTWGTAH
jgi:DNA polymerase-1